MRLLVAGQQANRKDTSWPHRQLLAPPLKVIYIRVTKSTIIFDVSALVLNGGITFIGDLIYDLLAEKKEKEKPFTNSSGQFNG